MTNEEAEKELEYLLKTWVPPFCPLINGECRNDCVSFSKHVILEGATGDFISGGYCINPMLAGDA